MDKLYSERAKIQKQDEWDKWVEEIPFIDFPKDWLIQLIPPFAGAIVRMQVKKAGVGHSVSIYLDCYDRLGYHGAPYWEVYPFHDDVGRCGINEIDELLSMIETGLTE